MLNNYNTYCLYCSPGKEGKIVQELEGRGYNAFSPIEIKRIFKDKNNSVMRKQALLPGYVFFEAVDGQQKDLECISRINGVRRFLEYSDGITVLRGMDLEFVAWLKKIGNRLDISKVVQVGTKIKVIDGPLKDYEGKIIEVKKQRKYVAIKIGFLDQERIIWCPIEYVDVI